MRIAQDTSVFQFEVSDDGVAVERSRHADQLKRANHLLDPASLPKGRSKRSQSIVCWPPLL
jgi:hypothetical protein